MSIVEDRVRLARTTAEARTRFPIVVMTCIAGLAMALVIAPSTSAQEYPAGPATPPYQSRYVPAAVGTAVDSGPDGTIAGFYQHGLAKYDNQLRPVWSAVTGGYLDLNSVAATSDGGGIALLRDSGGPFLKRYAFDGTHVWTRSLNGIATFSPGGIDTNGERTLVATAGVDAVALELDAAGNVIRELARWRPADCVFDHTDAAYLADGAIAVAAYSLCGDLSRARSEVRVLEPGGDLRFHYDQREGFWSISATLDGGFVLAGNDRETLRRYDNAPGVVRKIDAGGSVVWTRYLPPTDALIDVDARSGRIVVVGYQKAGRSVAATRTGIVVRLNDLGVVTGASIIEIGTFSMLHGVATGAGPHEVAFVGAAGGYGAPAQLSGGQLLRPDGESGGYGLVASTTPFPTVLGVP